MSKKLKSYLRTYRLRSGLTQTDIAFLLSLKSTAVISRLEKSCRCPSVPVLLAYCIIFKVSPDELVPGLFDDIEKAVVIRAKTLQNELRGNLVAPERIKFLDDLISGE